MVNRADIAYSVIIPTSNHPELLQQCLATLIQVQNPTKGWEVLVIDNSVDAIKSDNLQIVSSFQDSHFIYQPMPPLGLMAARHRGVEIARGEIIDFIDDDSFVGKNWLQGIEQSFSNPIVGLVCGPNYPDFEVAPPSWIDSFWGKNDFGKYLGYLSLIDFGKNERIIPTEFVWGCNYSIRKDIFIKARGSHPDYLPLKWRKFQGDGECGLSVKVSSLGYKAMYSPLCAIQHWVSKERMEVSYWENRAFFIGLHSSFTDIRRMNGLRESEGVPQLISQKPGFRRYIPNFLRRIKQNVSSFILKEEKISNDIIIIRTCLNNAFKEGWDYHQRQALNDPVLLSYVLRPNFMGKNALIPE